MFIPAWALVGIFILAVCLVGANRQHDEEETVARPRNTDFDMPL